MSDYAMQLPKGKTCADCVHAQRCVALGYSWLTRTRCDFYPLRYVAKSVRIQPAPRSGT